MSGSIFYMSLIFAEVKIPVIVVFTKFDLLIMEHFRACGPKLQLIELWRPLIVQRVILLKCSKISESRLLPFQRRRKNRDVVEVC